MVLESSEIFAKPFATDIDADESSSSSSSVPDVSHLAAMDENKQHFTVTFSTESVLTFRQRMKIDPSHPESFLPIDCFCVFPNRLSLLQT